MKKIYFIGLAILFVIQISAQTPLENAGYLFEDRNYTDAATAYKGLVEKVKKPELKSEIYAKIGDCYYFTQNFNEASEWYGKANTGGYSSGFFFLRYGDVKMYNGDYQGASTLFEKAKAADSTLIRLADIRLLSANNSESKQEYPSIVMHANAKELNSPLGEYGIGWMGEHLIFTSTRMETGGKTDKTTGQGFARLYMASPEGETWKIIGKLPESVNSAYNNGTFSYHEGSQTAYYAQCNGFDGKGKTCKIFSTRYASDAKTWSKPEELSFNSNEYNCSHPAISADGNTLYFSSDKPGGFGKKDLYKSIKGNANLWGDPINLGKEINGPGDEMFPTLSGDSLFVYSTDSREGLGGLDMYSAQLVNGQPRKPVWMDRPFNSAGDDFNLIYGKSIREGFYCSNRIGGFGSDDIYVFQIDPRYKTVAGYVRDDKTGLPLANAKVMISGTDGSKFETTTDQTGKFIIKNANPEISYRILGSDEGYFSNSTQVPAINLNSKENPEEKLKLRNNALLALMQITKDEIKLDNIYYAYNSAELTQESKAELMTLVKMLNETPNINIVINAHTDEQGSEKYNFQLSDKRAQSVVTFLIDNGIDSKRLTSKGWGESNPVHKNATTEEQHAANRRTTFQVTNF
ncbi:MAG: OmpA family protein [Flavobacteriales bacterium]|nr:OmpA family protein [Flavobacteriales bacterium]